MKKMSISDIYSRVLEKGRIIGFILLLLFYVIYITGIIAPYLPKETLNNYWSLSINEYLED